MTEQLPCVDSETQAVIEDALQKLWGVVNDLSRVRPEADRYRVAIFGSARAQRGTPIHAEVADFAERLTRLGCSIVTGGGPGLMQAANEGAQRGDPDDDHESVGVRIALPFEQGANPFVEKLYTHQSFFTRLHQFVRLSNAFVVVRGGIGTTLEMLLVWQLLQVRHVTDVPLILVGPMWEDLVAWSRESMLEGELELASPEDLDLPYCVESVGEASTIIEEHLERWRAEQDSRSL